MTEAPTGDFTGFEDGYVDAWLSQQVDSALQVTVPMTGNVEDFETGDPVGEATLDLWHSNVPTGATDQALTSDTSGILSAVGLSTGTTAAATSRSPRKANARLLLKLEKWPG